MKKYLPEQRLQKIIQLVEENNSIDIHVLCKVLKASPATIRRDLTDLESKKILTRTHGGAMSQLNAGYQAEYLSVLNKNLAEKQKIGITAVGQVENGETIFLEGSTTVIQIAKNLNTKTGLTVVTNAPYVALELANHTKNEVILIGGRLNQKILSTAGPATEKYLAEFRVDKAFTSISAIDSEYNITTALTEIAYVKKAVIKCAKQVIGVTDHTKFDKTMLNFVAPITALNKIIVDKGISEHHVKQLVKLGLEVIIAS
jgi:DeoR/GlpR family transcriptional regulator of sugar metabolism